jgi:hypothetical protein
MVVKGYKLQQQLKNTQLKPLLYTLEHKITEVLDNSSNIENIIHLKDAKSIVKEVLRRLD